MFSLKFDLKKSSCHLKSDEPDLYWHYTFNNKELLPSSEEWERMQSFSSDQLALLSKHPSSFVQTFIASNLKTPVGVLKETLRKIPISTREVFIMNQNTPLSLLQTFQGSYSQCTILAASPVITLDRLNLLKHWVTLPSPDFEREPKEYALKVAQAKYDAQLLSAFL